MTGVNGRVDDALERGWSGFVDLIAELIRARSASGDEGAAQEIVARRLRAAGASVEEVVVDAGRLSQLPGWGPTGADYTGRPNVVGTVKGSGGSRSLILSAHVDSVVPGPRELWERDPWTPAIVGDRLYGRGAWDDKAGVAMLIWLVAALRDADVRLAGDLIVESVIEEEISGNGTLACSERGYRADAAVVVDGRGPGNAVTAHCGQLWSRITVRGKTAAAVDSWRGRNAIEMLVPLIRGLRELESSLAGLASAPFDRVEHPVQLNIGVVEGGSTPTTVPGVASIEVHFTFPGPLTLAEMKTRVTNSVHAVADREGWTSELAPSVEFLSLQVPPFTGPPASELLGELDRAQRGVLGTPLEERTVAGFGDLRHFQLGGPTPCCLYGPTVGGAPHAVNEWVELPPLRDSARVLAAFVMSWCGTS